jgi:subtilisin family serine protease
MKPHLATLAAIALTVLASSATLPAAAQAADTRIVVKTADDLPRHRYHITGKAVDFLNDKPRFDALVAEVRKNKLADLAKYRIEDKATLTGDYAVLSQIAALNGDLATALEYSDKSAPLLDKEEDRLLHGVALRARIAALKVAGSESDPRFAAAYRQELLQRTSALPYAPIKDYLISVRNQARVITPALLEASVGNSLDPILAANNGDVQDEVAEGLVQVQYTRQVALPVLPVVAAAYGEIIDANANLAAAEDTWTPRLVTLAPTAKATPVVIGIWDSGVDTSLYPDQLWTNPGEVMDGKDNDGNGFVDDVHGIAFTLDHKHAVGPLASLADLKGDKAQLMGFLSASADRQEGIRNAGTDALEAYIKSLSAPQLKDFTEDMGLIGNYAHGTHVTGIAVAGNPFARVVYVTENFPHKEIPDVAPTIAEGLAWGASAKEAVAYLQKAGARVVNMSWRISRSAFEGELEAKGVGGTAAERAELSRKIYAGLRDGLEEAMRSAPGILFVAGSGNEDNDVDFSEYVPAGLRLPNLLTVGAVDARGKFTTFTTTGKHIELYADGYRIESFMPGGQKVKFSGTSMAAPQVTNLAAKLLALDPQLTPAQVIALMREHATPIADQPGRFVIDPKATVAALGM